MVKLKTRRSKIAFSFGMALLCIAVVFFLLRGPYLSNYIKRIIVPTIENITRERVIIGQAAINLFPFYVQAKSVKVFDEDGNQLLWITKTRAYIDISGLFSRKIRIRKFWFKEPRLKISRDELDRVIQNVNDFVSKGEDGGFSVSLHNVEMMDGELALEDMKERSSFSGTGMSFNMTVKNKHPKKETTARLLFEEAKLKLPELSEISGSLEGRLKMEDGRVEIDDVKVKSSESTLDLAGELLLDPDGRLKEGALNGKARIHTSTFKEIFGLTHERKELLTFKGKVGIIPGNDPKRPDFILDLKTDSSFYLETLMEIIGVDENITGLVSVKGEIKGSFPEVTGKGFARLEKAVFGRLPLDDAAGDIEYRDGRFTLNDLKAHTYEGELNGYAHIEVSNGDYAVNADATDIDSLKLFKYIRWEPPFPAGRVNGNFRLKNEIDRDFEIAADLDYLNSAPDGSDVLDRLRTITTSLELKGDMLTFDETVFSTSLSKLFLKGGIDLGKETLSLDLRLKTDEVNDLTAPYYTEFGTAGIFSGSAGGSLDDPEISGRLDLEDGRVHGIHVSGAFADLKYKTDSLAVEKLKVGQQGASYDLSGLIEFREAEELFSFKSPYFNVRGALQNAGIKQFVDLLSGDVPVEGIADGTITFEGTTEKFTGTGDLIFTDIVVYGQNITKAEMKTTFGPDSIKLHTLDAYQGKSRLTAEGTVSYDGNFDLVLSSEDFDTCDITKIEEHPLGVRFGSLNIAGSGTLDEPDMKFSGHIIKSYLNKKEIGTGDIEGTFKGRDLLFNGAFGGGLISANGKADLSGPPVWDAEIDIKKGRYDFLLSGLIDKAPDDITLSLQGGMTIKSRGSEHAVQSRFNHLELGGLGYELLNDKDVVLDLVNRELFIKSLSLSDDNNDVYASGSLKFRESYDVALIGNIDVASLTTISDKIGSLKGQGTYTINILGDWDSPEINGEINVKDTTVSLTDMPYMIGPVDGKFVFDRGNVTFDSVRTGFAGGSINMSGAGYMKKLGLEKLYVSALLSDIKVRPLERVSVALGGQLFYETSPDGSSFTGDIEIEKAKYEKDVEFDKLILGLKKMEVTKAEYPEFLRKTALNIHVEGKDDILIDNNVAATPVRISLNLTGTVEKYGLVGKVDALGGSIYFRNNEFTILEGSSVEFIDPESMVPVFHVLADSYISDYYIKLTLDGTMDQFNLSLFSNPPLSEMDILALLAFGKFSKESKGFESGLAASEAASMLTGDLQEAVGSQFRNITGFDSFQIEPHTTATGALGPKVTVGKRLIEDKLSVIYSTSIGTTEEHVIKLKYNVSKNVSMIGSRDEIGSAGVDLKYRFEFK